MSKILVKIIFANITDAGLPLEKKLAGPELLEKGTSVKKHGFWSTFRGGRRGQNFVGVVWGV